MNILTSTINPKGQPPKTLDEIQPPSSQRKKKTHNYSRSLCNKDMVAPSYALRTQPSSVFRTRSLHDFHLYCTPHWLNNTPLNQRNCAQCTSYTIPLSHIAGPRPPETNPYCEPKPLELCRSGNLDELSTLLDDDRDAIHKYYREAASGPDVTLLNAAAQDGHMKMVRMLLEKGARKIPESLCHAAEHGHMEIMEMLINRARTRAEKDAMYGASLEGKTPIDLAARNGHSEVIKRLIDNGFTVEDINISLNIAAEEGQAEVIKVLIRTLSEAKADIPAILNHSNALCTAAQRGDLDVIHLLIGALKKAGGNANIAASLNKTNARGDTPLHCAAGSGQPGVARVLIENGANWENMGEASCAPLHRAIKNGHTRAFIDVLLTTNVNIEAAINQPDLSENRRTGLHYACLTHEDESIKVLIDVLRDTGSNIETAVTTGDSNRQSCCHYIAEIGCANRARTVFDALSKAGDSAVKSAITQTDVNGHSPLYLSVRMGTKDVCEIMIGALKPKLSSQLS